jgi:cell division protein FtsW
MTLRRPTLTNELSLFILTCILCVLGILFVFEASVAEAFDKFGNQFYYVREQSISFIIGLVGLAGGVLMPSAFWKKISPAMYALSVMLLIMVFIPGLGFEVNGARRWIAVAGVNLQPVEVVKFAMIIFFASWMENHQKLRPFLMLTAVPVALLFLQPDMGSALIVISIAFGVYFLAGAPWRTFIMTGVAGVALLALLIVISPYRMKRVTTFLNPEADPLGASFQIRQIVIALGNGGLFGQGIGNSRQKFSYIPEASTDSIFSIIAEEVGFVGSVAIMLLFAAFLKLAHNICRKTPPGSYDHLLAHGILIWLGMQIVLNLSAVVALVPLTGIPLPFFSYGGTALVMILSVTGILIGIGRKYQEQ